MFLAAVYEVERKVPIHGLVCIEKKKLYKEKKLEPVSSNLCKSI